MATEAIKTKDLNKVLMMSNTNNLNMITERNGKIYRTPFKGEAIVSKIEKNDLFLFQDIVDDGEHKILSISYNDLLLPIIDPDNNPIFTERIDESIEYSIIPLERGAIDPNDGDWLSYDSNNPYMHGSIYIPIHTNTDYKFSCPSGEILKVRIFLCDSNKRIIHDKWNNGISNYKEISLSQTFSTDNDAAMYLMFDIKGAADISIELRINTKLDPITEHVEFSKINYINQFSTLVSDTLDSKYKQFEIYNSSHSAVSTTVTIRAPYEDPLKSTLRLLNTGVKTSQFVDLASVRDDESIDTRGRFEIGIRSFEADTPTPDFVIGFADTMDGELIHKLTIDHDALAVRFTKSGIQFRTNTYANNTPSDGEIVTINFKDLSKSIDKIYTSLQAYGILNTDFGEELELSLSADMVAFNNVDLPTVDMALNHIMTSHTSDMASYSLKIEELTNTVLALDMSFTSINNSHKDDMNALTETVNGYDDKISSAVNDAAEALSTANGFSENISALELDISSVKKSIEDVKSECNTSKINLTAEISTLEQNTTKALQSVDAVSVGGIKFVILDTMEEYENSEKDPSTIYFIKESSTDDDNSVDQANLTTDVDDTKVVNTYLGDTEES